ncbi:hypothetical protein sphantq_02686 [Sphingobium sp. AntQ-1]|nr:hypothetical protein sphantq_02686 [Sphingobium sp. AntQ-1]
MKLNILPAEVTGKRFRLTWPTLPNNRDQPRAKTPAATELAFSNAHTGRSHEGCRLMLPHVAVRSLTTRAVASRNAIISGAEKAAFTIGA